MRSAMSALFLLLVSPALGQAPPPVPALPDVERRTAFVLSAQTGPFSIGMQLYGDGTDFGNWVGVYLNGTLQDPSTYIIASASGTLATAARPITDGQITFNSSTTGTVQIVGAQRPRRLSQFQENRGVSARDLNVAISGIVTMLREAWDMRARVLQAPPGETLAVLPPAAARASLPAGFDANGNLTSFTGVTPGTTVSSAMAPVVSAATLADAITAMGVAPANILPIGTEVDWPSVSPPSMWLMEWGQPVSRASFPELLAAVAPTFPATVTNGSASVTGISSTEGWPASGMAVECGTHAYTITVTGAATGTLNTNALASCTSLQIFPHGNGTPGTTFNVPDGRNVVYVGRGNMGGSDRALLNATYFLADPKAMATLGGLQSHTMTTGEMVAHTHVVPPAGSLAESAQHTHSTTINHVSIAYTAGGVGADVFVASGGAGVGVTSGVESAPHSHALTGSTASTGSTTPFSTVQPSAVRNKIIYAGH